MRTGAGPQERSGTVVPAHGSAGTAARVRWMAAFL